MTKPRCQLVCVEETPYYHVTARCVRRAFLCGFDQENGQDYEHRRAWIEARIYLLSTLFAIDVCSYAVMSNHYHIVLKLCPDQAKLWCDHEVCQRWLSLFNGPLLMQMFAAGKALNHAQLKTVESTLTIWRQRLTSLSWFMKCLNEPIARMANVEDQCKGHFWEARYTSQCLKTEQALLSCMAYVDLNPIRANMAVTPEASDYTSIKARISPSMDLTSTIQQQIQSGQLQAFDFATKTLMPFTNTLPSIFPNTSIRHQSLPCTWHEYLDLIDWSGRIVRPDKQGAIPANTPPILERLTLNKRQWIAQTTRFEVLHRKLFNRETSVFKFNTG